VVLLKVDLAERKVTSALSDEELNSRVILDFR